MHAPFFTMPFNPTHKVSSPGDIENNAASYFPGVDSDSVDLGGMFNFGGDWLTAQWNNFKGITAQQELQSNQQEFDEYMYQMYNSPQALKEQFREAGLNTNLLGSTSFGTAQSAAGAPAVAGNNPVTDIASAVQSLASAESLRADVPLKESQSDYYSSMPDLNKALTRKYGADAAVTEKEFDFINETWQWKLMNAKFTAKGAQQAYFNAIQEYRKKKQEYNNLVKEGKILDNEENITKWEVETKEYIYNFLVEHDYYPDANYLDRVYNDFIKTGDYAAFSRFIRAFREVEDQSNKSKVATGAVGGKVKIGPVELDTTTIEYGIAKGKKLWEIVKEAEEGQSSDSGSVTTTSTVGDEVNQEEIDSAYSTVQSYINGSPYYSERGYVPESFDTSKITEILIENGYEKKDAQRIARMLWLKMNK